MLLKKITLATSLRLCAFALKKQLFNITYAMLESRFEKV